MTKSGPCNGCGKSYPIINRTHWLCQSCNHMRIHGETEYETKIKKANSYTQNRDKKPTSIKKSKKQTYIDKKYVAVCIEIDLERESKCDGCGKYRGGDIILSHSHIISRNDCKNIGRPDLVYNRDNIKLHCLDFMNHSGCHAKWEGLQKGELNDFVQNMLYIKSINENLYNIKIVNLSQDYIAMLNP